MTDVSKEINKASTICQNKRFSGFWRANSNRCNAEDSRIVNFPRMFAENGLTRKALKFVE